MQFINWIKGITTPTSSRWGIFTIFITAGFALIAVAISTWGVLGMTTISPQMATFLFWLGIGAIGLGVVTAFIWILTGHRDTTAEDIKSIRGMLEEDRRQRLMLQDSLALLSWILEQFKKRK